MYVRPYHSIFHAFTLSHFFPFFFLWLCSRYFLLSNADVNLICCIFSLLVLFLDIHFRSHSNMLDHFLHFLYLQTLSSLFLIIPIPQLLVGLFLLSVITAVLVHEASFPWTLGYFSCVFLIALAK